VGERTAELNRIAKVREGANIKLTSVVTSMTSASGRAMIAAIVAGETDPAAMAELAQGRLRSKRLSLEAALQGRVRDHQRFILKVMLAHLDELETRIAELSAEIEARMHPFEPQIAALTTIPGIGRRTAQTVLAEVGADMSRFPSAGHLASWAGLCPGHDESAGKRRSGRTRKGSPWLRAALVEASLGACRTTSYVSARFHRIAARRGGKRAAVATAHLLLVIAHRVLGEGTTYHDLGPNYFDERDRERVRRRLTRRLEALGYAVALTPAA
jgi:transposase